MTAQTHQSTQILSAEPQWLSAPCDECGAPVEVLARLGGEEAGVDVCAACLRGALRMLEA